jgi:D,D-heptose 1,7-bisphosphate phosphatase
MKRTPGPVKQKAIFIDKDGTLVNDIPYNVVPGLIDIYSDAIEGLRILKADGFLVIVVSNQSGIAHGYFSMEDLQISIESLKRSFEKAGVNMDAFYCCPHHPHGKVTKYAKVCRCRKPAPGLLLRAGRDLNVDLHASWMIGDILDDVEAGNRASCHTILIDRGNETIWSINDRRQPDFIAQTVAEAARFIHSSIRSKS